MENRGKIGCSAGRAKIVDPNDFDGFKSADNVPVQLEDLNISVSLTSFRKARTLLTGEKEGGIKDNVSQISVNFIEGNSINGGKKVLTTSYTDLTTSFDTGVNNDETLGITNIDIEFNASMAPMITINFIDVRGSSIFQNEENILNNRGNKYTTFFQMPYPMFELEVKGYYGYPVKYCLHLLKFNSKFNSQTGNFELTANFVGYTFALMSDMLIGYLKAIPFTKIGKQQFDKYNETKSGTKVLSLSDLSKAISLINDGIDKEVNENPAAKELNAVEEGTEQLDLIKNQINQLGQAFDLSPGKDEFQYIIFNNADKYTPSQQSAINDLYKVKVKEYLDKYKELNPNGNLIDSNFLSIESTTNKDGGKLYKNITIEELKTTTSDSNLALKLGSPSDIEVLKQKILKYINTNNQDPKIGEKAKLDIFDMTLLYDIIGKSRKSLEVSGKDAKVKLAKAFENEVRDIIGFDPTARTIIECYTAAIETFIETIFLVSEAASKSTERTDELGKKFKEDDEVNKMTDMNKENISKLEFFPWPDYREKDAEKNSYVDKYLGAADVLDSPERVNELVFIDDLLQAFRKAALVEKEITENEGKAETTWSSVSPYDSSIFTDSEPYERAGTLTTLPDVVRLMAIRAMIFLGYSNDTAILTDEEIKAMGIAEVNNMLRGVKDAVVKQALTQISLPYVKKISGKINGDDRPVIEKSGTDLYYNYIYKTGGADGFKVMPIDKGFNNEEWGNPDTNPKINDYLVGKQESEYLFLTNYSDGYADASGNVFKKPVDGGLNIRIIETLPSPKTIETVEGAPTETIMNLALLSENTVTAEAGYNSFNPNYGVQEYKDMDWGNKDLEGLPLMYVFYRNCDSGLALTRAASKDAQSLKYDASSPFFHAIYKDIEWPDNKGEAYETGYMDKNVRKMTGKEVHSRLGENRELFNGLLNGGSGSSITYPYVELKYGNIQTDWTFIKSKDEPRTPYTDYSFSLFGSEFYYQQSYAEIIKKNNKTISCSDYSRAFLFLQTLPFNTVQTTGNPFGKNEIKHLFDMKAGIIHAPRMWCAYIGSMLWRMDTSDPETDSNGKITGGGSGKQDPIVWSINYTNGDINKSKFNPSLISVLNPLGIEFNANSFLFDIPGRLDEYFPTVLDYTRGWFGDLNSISYPDLENVDTINTLPQQVKNEFKRMFFEFVNGTSGKVSWESLADKLEIFDTSISTTGYSFRQYLKAVRALDENIDSNEVGSSTSKIVTGFGGVHKTKTNNIKNYYDVIVPIDDAYISKDFSTHDFYLFLQLKDGTSAVTSIIDAMTDEVFIINNNPKIWKGGWSKTERTAVSVDESKFDIYFAGVIETLSGKTDEYNISKQNENLDMSVFGTSNKDIIRLQLYRNCKNIYDKWLGGAADVDHLVFQCGDSRSGVDNALAAKYGNTKTRMIDSFRFVTRNFRDIGDSLYINPLPINNYLIGNPNSAAYDGISSILAANNFNFQALPNFVNFHDDENLKAIFTPYSYKNGLLASGSCGPAFVCVYDGQASKHLELKDGNYPNDGFDLRCMNGSVDVSVPEDFTSQKYEDYEDPISTFMVRYSQQNQNIFKDIDLDQSEFSETDESIQIQDEISQKGSENNRAIVGQNIYNVYAVRSYTAKVEMMGNAMIQPMMYFQLDNIPMFHGAYLITKVSHSIKPNSMSTNFSGTRIRYPETPLIKAYDVYMDLLETLDLSDAGTGTVGGGGGTGGGNSVNGKFAPIIGTIIDNGGFNGKIVAGKIKTKPLPKIEGLTNAKLDNKAENQILAEAVDPFVKMMGEYVTWLKGQGFAGTGGNYVGITSMFRDYQKQVQIKEVYGGGAATPGTSNHGWGIAVDLQFYNKKGVKIDNTKNTAASFKFTNNPAIQWLYDNSYRFGWVFPVSLRDGNPLDEHWHFEYHGTSAKCIMENNPTIYGYTVKVDKPIDASVKNPQTPEGKEAVYTNCDFVYKKKEGDGEDGVDNNKDTAQATDAENDEYFKKLLKKLGAPETEGNLIWFKAWRQMEGGKATWNAFNSTQKLNGSTKYNTTGVQNYKTMDDGVQATYTTLTNGKYPNVVNGLKAGIADKAAAYNLAVELQKTGKDLCIWVKGPKGCASQGGIPASQYLASCLKYKVSGNNVYKPK